MSETVGTADFQEGHMLERNKSQEPVFLVQRMPQKCSNEAISVELYSSQSLEPFVVDPVRADRVSMSKALYSRKFC